MASYLEIAKIKENASYGDFIAKLTVAVAIKAHAIAQLPTPAAEQIKWAKEALSGPHTKSKQIMGYVLADNNSLTIVQMMGAGDTAIQNNVNDAVDLLLSK